MTQEGEKVWLLELPRACSLRLLLHPSQPLQGRPSLHGQGPWTRVSPGPPGAGQSLGPFLPTDAFEGYRTAALGQEAWRVGSLRGLGSPRATHWLHRRWPWGWPRLSGEEGDSRPSPKHAEQGGHAGPRGPQDSPSPVPAASVAWLPLTRGLGASASPCCGPGLRASLMLQRFTGPMPPSSSHPLSGHLHKSCHPLVRRKQVAGGRSTQTLRLAGPSLEKGCAAGTRETSCLEAGEGVPGLAL